MTVKVYFEDVSVGDDMPSWSRTTNFMHWDRYAACIINRRLEIRDHCELTTPVSPARVIRHRRGVARNGIASPRRYA